MYYKTKLNFKNDRKIHRVVKDGLLERTVCIENQLENKRSCLNMSPNGICYISDQHIR